MMDKYGQALLNNAGVSKAEEAGKNFAQGFAKSTLPTASKIVNLPV